ncbi:MAG: YdeI/OmpD-associated family protein [Pseudomonadota bacterium]
MIGNDDYDKVEIASAAALWDWLEANHSSADTVWMVTFKKAVPDKFVSTGEVLDALVAYGWIDGIRRKLDDERTMQLISPRKTEHWAKTYKDRAAALIPGGRVQAAGLKSIEAGKASGLWTFMDDVDALVVPDDLRKTLDKTAGAASFFDNAAPSYRRNVLRWIKLAKTEPTRRKRLDQTATYSARGEKIPQM